MWNSVFVAIHASAAVVAFAMGLASLRYGGFLTAYRVALWVMAGALVPAVLVDWAETDVAARVAFTGLLGLAAAMVVRAELAARCQKAGGPPAAYVEHVGFTLISLAVGFAVVSGIRIGAPGWLVAATGVGIVLLGRRAVGRAARRTPLPAAG